MGKERGPAKCTISSGQFAAGLKQPVRPVSTAGAQRGPPRPRVRYGPVTARPRPHRQAQQFARGRAWRRERAASPVRSFSWPAWCGSASSRAARARCKCRSRHRRPSRWSRCMTRWTRSSSAFPLPLRSLSARDAPARQSRSFSAGSLCNAQAKPESPARAARPHAAGHALGKCGRARDRD